MKLQRRKAQAAGEDGEEPVGARGQGGIVAQHKEVTEMPDAKC